MNLSKYLRRGRRLENKKHCISLCKHFAGNLICGVCLAVILWKLMMLNFSLSLKTELNVLVGLVIFIGIGFAVADNVKCIILLILVGIVGKSGRSYLRAITFAFIIAGPIENLSTNGAEIVRVFTCSTILSYNLTKARLDLMTEPFKNTLAHMRDDVTNVEKPFAQMHNIVLPLHKEIEVKYNNATNQEEINQKNSSVHEKMMVAATNVQKNYEHKFEMRCKQQLAKGKKRCLKAFQSAFDNCQNRFPNVIRTILCWPYRINFICKMNLLGDPNTICDPGDAIPKDFGNNYIALKQTEQELYGNKSVKVSYKVNSNVTSSSSIRKVDQAADAVLREFNHGKSTFDRMMHLTRYFLVLLFIRIIFASFSYFKNYRCLIDFDNVYITDYFRRIDQQRQKTGKSFLLPLKKYEQKHLIDLSRCCNRTNEESGEIIFQLLHLSMEIVISCLFLMLDHAIVLLLQIVRRRSLISYVQEGEHRIKFKVRGKGLLARLLHSTLSNFNIHKQVSTLLSNEKCLPTPSALPHSYYIKLVILYVVVILLIFKSTALLRLRRVICSQFNYKREKERILFLYNNTKRHRRLLFERMLKIAQTNVADRKLRRRFNLLLRLRLRCVFCCNWLKCLKAACHKCLICDQFEDEHFKFCCNKKCSMPYCGDCWQNLHGVCVACHYHIQIEA